MRGLKMRRHMSGEIIMPFCAPKSSPVQMPSTPSSTSRLPMAMLNSMVRSRSASMYGSPMAMSVMNFSRPVMCQAISNMVSSTSPMMKYSPRYRSM